MAIVYRDKEYRNLQEQVFKNMNDIAFLLQENGVLNEFGIKVVGQEASALDMPTVDDYKEDNPEWGYGDAYAIGTEAPYELYILTRANGSHPLDYWFNIGEFPVPGPEGPEGPAGATGPQGPTGPTGQNGISPQLGVGNVVVETLEPDQDATVAISESGTINNPIWNFNFGIPRGADGSVTTSLPWGAITGSITNQTDLANALQAKANASALASYATQVYANNVASNATYQANVYTDSQLSEYAKLSASVNSFTGDLDVGGDLSLVGYIKQPVSGGYINVFELPSESGKLALVSEIPDLTGYAKESWVSANFLSIGTPIGGAAVWGSISGTLSDQTDLMSKFSEYALLSDIPSLSGYATQSWVTSQGYLTSVPSEYATISQVSSAISAIDYASVGALSSETVIPDITGLASEGYVNTQIANLSSVYAPIGDYATTSDLSSAISGLSSVYASISALSDYALASVVSALNYASVGALSSETYIPRVGGDNDGSYWTSITLGDDTYDIPQGGPSGDYVPVLVEESEEDPEMPQYRYAGTITNSATSIVETVEKEEPDQVAANKTTSLELYQDDAYLSHSYQEMVSKDNPDYDPEDPESSPTIEEAVDLSTDLCVGEGTVTVNRSSYDEGTQEVVDEQVDLFELASMSYVDASISALSSVYQPIGSYASQADIDALSSVYAPIGYVSGSLTANSSYWSTITINSVTASFPFGLYAQLSGSNTFTARNYFTSRVDFSDNVYFSSAIHADALLYTNNLRPNGSTYTLGVSNAHYAGVYANIIYGSDNVGKNVSEIATLSDIPSVSGYAELSADNVFTGYNTFSRNIALSRTISGSNYTAVLSIDSSGFILSAANITLSAGGGNGVIYANNSIVPLGVENLGSGGSVWNSIYATNIHTSSIDIASATFSSAETWTFTLSDNTTVSKTILVG